MIAPLLHSDPVTLQYLLPRMDKNTIGIGLNLDVVGNRYADARELISRGADVNYIDSFGESALHYAAGMDFGDTRMIELLLRSGADVKLRTKDGQTPLALAKKYGNTELQKALERAGALE
jgi:ankyrin repeat protein